MTTSVGRVIRDWRIIRIEDIARVGMGPFGSSIKVSTFVPSGVPVISGQHLHGSRVDESPGFNFVTPEHAQRLSNANVHPGDVIFTHAGNIGQVAYIPRTANFTRYVISQRQFYLRCDETKADPAFLTHFFRSREGQHKLLANSSQVGVPSIAQPVSYLRSVEIPMPPLREQRAIAGVLGALDDRIELNRRMNETLEAMARALFKSWFVDFDPVRAKMEGRDPKLPPEVADLFPDRLVASELGEIPEGWEPGALRHLAVLNPEVWNSTEPPETIRYLDLKNTKWGVLGDVPCYRWQEAPSRARRVLRNGDTVVGTVRPGNGSYALIDEDGLTGSTGFAVLRPCAPHDRELLWCAATSPDNVNRLALLADGGAYPAIGGDMVAATPVVLADARVRREFSATVGPLVDEIGASRRTFRRLAEIRDTLLPALVSGEVRLPAALVDRYADPGARVRS